MKVKLFNKKVFSIILSVIMLISVIPVGTITASAETSGYYTYSVSDGEAEITGYEGSISGDITIPSELGGYPVTSIGNCAFEGCENLTSVTIPSSVTSIGDSAFYGCFALTSVTIPNSVTSIGDRAFFSCDSLTSVTIPNSVTSIGEAAFSGCSSLTSITIPGSVTSIGDWAFSWCISLTSVTIPNSVTSICDGAFRGCTGLTSVTIPNSVTSIGNSAFECCSSLTSIAVDKGSTTYDSRNGCNAIIETKTNKLIAGCKNTVIPNSVKSIGAGAFKGSGLTSITIPSSVTSVGDGAFQDCSNLTSITIPGSVTSIGDGAFQDCSNLTSITIPGSVTRIGDWAFYGCKSLTSVTIPNSVTSIGEDAFEYCENLTSITIPESVTSIGDSAFASCSSLTSITIPGSVTSIGDSAFASCSSLTSITIPGSVTRIGDYAFYWCSSLTDVYYGGYTFNWKKIRIGEGNESLLNSKIHYKSHSNHTYKTTVTKATTSKNGSIVKTCDCGAKTTTPVYYPKTFKLSTTSYTYDGKVKKPAVTVKDSAGKTISSANYTVTYASGRKYVGKYAVKVTFKGSYYSGSKMLYFNINPRNTSISKLTSGRKSFKVYLRKYTTQTTGYQIQYSTSSKFTGAKTVTVSNKTTAKTISKLYGGKRYYVRCRTYKKVGKTNFFSSWSGAKAVTTRK